MLKSISKLFHFYRATRMHSADYAVARCLSVRLSHAGIEPKWLYISSKFFHCWVAPPFYFFGTKRDGNIPTRTPLTGASNAREYNKMTIFSQISRSISETLIVRWAHAAKQFLSIEFSFHPYKI